MIITTQPVRVDSEGNGHLGESRGWRRHEGVDFEMNPGWWCDSDVTGRVTRIIQCYGDTEEFKGVEILVSSTDFRSLWRYLYILPTVRVGEEVRKGDALGIVQDISKRYGGNMRPHVHLEVNVDPRSLIMPES